MKKIAGAGLMVATLVTSTVGMGNIVLASSAGTTVPIKQSSEQAVQLEDSTNYIKFTGVISELNPIDQSITLIVQNEENSTQMIFPVTDEVLLLNSSTTEELEKAAMEKGLHVEVYYDKNKPMPLIYPATITPKVIVVQDKEIGQVKLSKFDDNLISLDHELKLNLSEDTVLLNEQGERIKEDELHGKELIVFYTFSTKSIPAQTSPKKIIALDYANEPGMKIEQLINEDHYIKEGTKMIPVRKVAEHLGCSVEWDQESSRVIVSKQNQSFTISIGEKAYGYNRSIRYFDVTPEMLNGRTYVPVEFLQLLSMD